jgi:aspartate carbamoyltransferase catalytic subunit
MTNHLLGIRTFPPEQIELLISTAREMKDRVRRRRELPVLSQRTVGLLFFEGSTRTRVSFEQAAHYLGLKVTSFAGPESSMSKGETLKDTILTLRYERLDAMVMRHRLSGAGVLAARFFEGPVINAGDGQHEHPTQALADALTILERKGRIEGLRVAIIGDVEHSRVARSNAWLLSKLGAEVRFVGPRMLMPAYAAKLPAALYYDLAAGIEGADVAMCLRLQKERMTDGLLSSVGEYRRLYQVNRESMRGAKRDCIVMHPGPINRGIEVDDQIADGPHSVITQQVENGIFVRMAAYLWAFGAIGLKDPARKPRPKAKAEAGA